MKLFLRCAMWLAPCAVFAAGSLVETRESDTPPQRISLAWTAALDGTVAVTSQPVRGVLNRVVFQVGAPAPSNATYAVTLKDAAGVDLLAGQGAAVATNSPGTASQIVPGILVVTTTGITNLVAEPVVSGCLSLGITNVGTNATAGKQGSVTLYLK